MGINGLNINDLGGEFRRFATGEESKITMDGRTIKILGSDNKAQTVTFNKILDLIRNNQDILNPQQKADLSLGLQFILAIRELTYSNLSPLGQIWVSIFGDYNKNEAASTKSLVKDLMKHTTIDAKATAEQEKTEAKEYYKESLRAEINKLDPSVLNTIPIETSNEDLKLIIVQLKETSKELLQKKLSTYLADPSIKIDLNNHHLIFKLTEDLARKYTEDGEFKKAFAVRLQTAEQIPPDSRILDAIQINESKKPETVEDGVNIPNLDTNMLKNGVLHATVREIDNQFINCFDFKISHTTRRDVQANLVQIEANLDQFHNAFPAGFCKDVKIEEVRDGYYVATNNKFSKFNRYLLGKAKEITFTGVGKVIIGKNVYENYEQVIACQANRVQIEMDPSVPKEKIPQYIQLMLSSLGMSPLLTHQNNEDEEKIKVFQLLRSFYPEIEYKYTRDSSLFDKSVDDLKKAIIEEQPAMEQIFSEHLADMYKQEISPGNSIWAIKDYAKKLREVGAVGLMAGASGASINDLINITLKIMKNGALSTEDRYKKGLIIPGASSVTDLSTGGGDSVFTRLITSSQIENKDEVAEFPFHGSVQFLYDLKLLERVGYGYLRDKYGSKAHYTYDRRLSQTQLVSKIADQQSNITERIENEYCVKKGIPPLYLQGLLIQSEEVKIGLMEALMGEQGKELVTIINGQATFNGIPLEDFIHVGDTFKKEYWAQGDVQE